MAGAFVVGRIYAIRMPSFTLDGTLHEYLKPSVASSPEEIHSREYGHYSKVMAGAPLKGGGSVDVVRPRAPLDQGQGRGPLGRRRG